MECIDGRTDRRDAFVEYCTLLNNTRAIDVPASIDVAHWGGRGSGSEALGLVLCASRGFHMEIPSQLVAADTSLKDHLSLF